MTTTPHASYCLPLPSGPCPPADNPAAILLWLYWRHLDAGRISKRREHEDPFWRRIDAKHRDRLHLAENLRLDPEREARIGRLAACLSLDLAGLDDEGRIEAVAAAYVPMRFHLSAALEELGETERAAEVLVAAY